MIDDESSPNDSRFGREINAVADGLIEVQAQGSAGYWPRLTFVLMGGLIALPAFVVGAQFAGALGMKGTAFASFGGGAIVAAVSALSGAAGARTRLSSYALIIKAFGQVGGKLVNALLSAILIGWFGVIAMMFGNTVLHLVPASIGSVPAVAWAMVGVAMMTFTAIVGFKALDMLSMVTLPFKIGLLAWAATSSLRAYGTEMLWHVPAQPPFDAATGASLLAGGVITGGLLVPDVCRFAKSPIHAVVACLMAYGVGLPLVLVLAGIPAQLTGQQDLVATMVSLGLGLPAFAIVLLAAWTNNTYNLYSTTLVYSTLAPRQPHWRLALAAGIIGAGLALLGIADHLTKYLEILSICVPPVAGVFLVEIYAGRAAPLDERWRWQAFLATGAGMAIAACEKPLGLTFSTVTAIDALVCAALVHWLLTSLSRRRLLAGSPA